MPNFIFLGTREVLHNFDQSVSESCFFNFSTRSISETVQCRRLKLSGIGYVQLDSYYTEFDIIIINWSRVTRGVKNSQFVSCNIHTACFGRNLAWRTTVRLDNDILSIRTKQIQPLYIMIVTHWPLYRMLTSRYLSICQMVVRTLLRCLVTTISTIQLLKFNVPIPSRFDCKFKIINFENE